MEQAREEPPAENLHEWRKQGNHLRHQLQVLQTLGLGQVKATLREFKSLAETLGLKNGLQVLSQQLERRRRFAEALARQTLQELPRQQDEAFAEHAFRLGQRLYARKAKAFTRLLWP